MLVDSRTGALVVPNGTLGDRFGESGAGKWNLDLGDVVPALSLLDTRDDTALVDLPRFDLAEGAAPVLRRGVPVRRVGDQMVTTVFDLLLAQYGVGREGFRASGPAATTTSTASTRRPGRSRSRRCRRRPSPGSPASSRRTPPTPRAAR